MGDDSLASPSSTDRFVFPEPDGTEPPPVPSPSRRPSLRPQGHGRVPSVSAINTAVPRPAAPPSTSNFATSHLVRGKALGKGSHGSVYLVQDRDSAELYALKEILPQADPKMHRQVMGSLWEEMRLLSNLKHDNVVQVVRLVYNGASPASTSSATSSATPWTPLAPAPQMLMEYVSGGSIASLIRSLDPLPFPEALAAHLGRQVAKGLAYLHSMNVIHRDIKGANVLVTPAGTAKISDFGISLDRPGGKGVYSTIARTELKGTCFFMAPEATKKHYSAKVDIWSFGCLVLEMLSGRAPWPHCEAFTVLRWLYRGENLPPPLPPVIGDDAAPPYPPPTDRGDRGFLNPSTPHISHSAGVDAIGLGIINLSKRSIVVTREARALLDLCLRVDPAARPTATDLVCFSPFLAPRPYDFVAEWPRLLDAARTLQPAAAAASDGTAVHDPADLEEEEEDDEDGECEGTEYEGESGEDDECPEGCDCEYCHEDGDDHEDGEAEAGPSRAPEEAAPKSSPDEDGNDDAGTLR
ncbi:kinase-like domain-containing protein [Hyaloraphidium curvatum]|nr:kinase-like domain-containing protein [Hyaloraphidium curvatum]